MAAKQACSSFPSDALRTIPYAIIPGQSRNFDLIPLSECAFSNGKQDPASLVTQLKTVEWLARYGLRSNKLTFDQILQKIGFKRVESFNSAIGKNVTAKYAGNFYHEVQHDNGDRYVLTCRPEKLDQFHNRLQGMLNLLHKRLAFLTSGSRRLFGVIGDQRVYLVLDCKTTDYRTFSQFQSAVTSLLKEQIINIERFNMIWVSTTNEQFREQSTAVTPQTIDQAIDWICDRKCSREKISANATCEAVLKGFNQDFESIYLISEGQSSDTGREMLRDSVVNAHLSSTTLTPVHIASLFCHDSHTQTFLRSMADNLKGSYFCYKIKGEISDLKPAPNLFDPTRIKFFDDKLLFGTNALASTLEYPVDLTLMYREIIECENSMGRLEKILGFIREETESLIRAAEAKRSLHASQLAIDSHLRQGHTVHTASVGDNIDMASFEWLKTHGIESHKLDLFSVLLTATFQHSHGPLTVLMPPASNQESTASTPATPHVRHIHAKYCDHFARVTWPDGTVRHVHVTVEFFREHEKRVRTFIGHIRARLGWLKKGSRDLFGTVRENNIYILIDSSTSMQNHLSFVKEKVRLLIQDQLYTKERVNLVAFSSTINPWRDRLTKIVNATVDSQLHTWLDGLVAEGTTNTLAALRFALADSATEAIYLLTDGRPDQSERHILSQVQHCRSVAIHTIAFNCQDQAANQFLFDLARQSGGRFHAFTYGLEIASSVEMPESDDISILKDEILRAERELAQIAALRDECLGIVSSHSSLHVSIRASSVVSVRERPRKKRPSKDRQRRERARSAEENPDPSLPPAANAPAKPPKIQTPFDEVKAYLKKNSLLRKGLTIFDVLHPTTFIVREPRHTQIIDRQDILKIWDKILPLAYGPFVGKLRLLNQYAVDLDSYEKKLRDLLNEYHQFTSTFIWKQLSDEIKLKLAPTLYWNNLSKEDQLKITQQITDEEYTNQTVLEMFAWKLLSEDEQRAFLQESATYVDKQRAMLKNELKTLHAKSALEGIARMDIEIERGVKFLRISTDLRQLQTRVHIEPKPVVDNRDDASRRSSTDRSVGQRVICRYDVDGYFYPGTEQKNPDGQRIIHFDMNKDQDITDHTRLPISGAIAQPGLSVKDHVLVRHRDKDVECWAPGVVLVLPSPTRSSPPLYTIKIDVPSVYRVDVYRRDLIKISEGLYRDSVNNIRKIRQIQAAEHRAQVVTDVKAALREHLEPMNDRLEQINKSHRKRYKELRIALGDQMTAIRQVQEKAFELEGSKRSGRTKKAPVRLPEAVPSKTLVTERRESTKPTEQSEALSLTSKPIPANTIVVARWLDDGGLVYKGTIREEAGDEETYLVQRQDPYSFTSTISRDDIYLESDHRLLKDTHVGACILVEVPGDYRHCWSPAVVDKHNAKESKSTVRFDDDTTTTLLDSTDVILIDQARLERYKDDRIAKGENLVGQVTVGLNNTTGTFMLGTIREQSSSGNEYTIEWYDGTQSIQDERHLFGAFHRCLEHRQGALVLAINADLTDYEFAKIISMSDDQTTLTVRYIDSTTTPRQVDVPTLTTFVVTPAYYDSVQTMREDQR